MKRLVVLNIVGLTRSLIGPQMPRISAFAGAGSVATIDPVLPAVTCTAQSTYLTGRLPREHGIVGNGWYHRELAEVQFWKQSNHLVQARKLWEDLREHVPRFTCAKLFWWYNMYSSADYSITPRPMYPADGRKVFDIYTGPLAIRHEIKKDLGEFPFAGFWGPAAGVRSPQGEPDCATRWIAESAKWIEKKFGPTLNLIYLPHLDYNLQRLGPSHPEIVEDLGRIDTIAGELIDFFREREVELLILSEYGITPVDTPIHLNRLFRHRGWLAIKDELGLEMLDCGASRAFVVADHQCAHIYLNDPTLKAAIGELVAEQPGVASVLDEDGKKELGLDHARAGDLVAFAREDAWFTYYYWLDDAFAPDFARSVDIHRKPGYDPVELFVDPRLRLPKLKIAWRLLEKKLGFRMLMDVIPLDPALVRGSHGTRPANQQDYPVVIAAQQPTITSSPVAASDLYTLMRSYLVG